MKDATRATSKPQAEVASCTYPKAVPHVAALQAPVLGKGWHCHPSSPVLQGGSAGLPVLPLPSTARGHSWALQDWETPGAAPGKGIC